MKIVSVETCSLDAPMPAQTAVARRPSYNKTSSRAYPINKYPEFPRTHKTIPGEPSPPIFVRVTAENGQWGIGSCQWGHVVKPLIEDHFAPLVIGRDCFATELISDILWRSTQRFGGIGLSTIARSAIDLALWDLKGKLLERPVYSLIGGPSRAELPLYCTTDDLDWGMELGFRAFKISNTVHYEAGEPGLNILEDKVAKARETVGRDADLMINPVMSYSADFAARFMERIKPYNLRWVEEPLMPHDIDGLVELKRAVPSVPIATGEDHHGRHAFREMVQRRCVDVLQPDLRFCGGLTEALKIYAIGEAAGLPTIPHNGAGSAFGQHFSMALPEAPMAEYWLAADPGVPLDQMPRVPGTCVPVDGKIKLSDAPGFGFEIKPEWLVPWHR